IYEFLGHKPESQHSIMFFLRIVIPSIICTNLLQLVKLEPFGNQFKDDTNRNIHQIIQSRGFYSEPHFIPTRDGFVLQLVRIMNPFVRNRNRLRPVLLFHGFQCSSTYWLITSKGILLKDGNYYEYDDESKRWTNGSQQIGNTLGFVLATKGYDVWLANYRGSVYSETHLNLDAQSEDFWSFSIDEMVEIDLPTMIDYIRTQTNRSTISYIGHSQGNFIMLALLSEQPHYSERIEPFIALSPVFYMANVVTPLRFYIPLIEVLRTIPSLVPFRREMRATYTDICGRNDNTKNFCFDVYRYFLGGHPQNLNMNRTLVYMSHVPMGSSSWNAAHLLQLIQSGQPRHFDYGPEKNLIKYGKEKPPIYDASRIDSKHIALIYSKNDFFNHFDNVEELKSKLRNDYYIDDETWGHMDFVWSKFSGRIVNERILKLLNMYLDSN
ncbi:Lipase 3, partial [Sarcoptes scabiei]